MGLMDAAIGTLAPRLGIGVRMLREQLAALGVTVPLSAGCLEALVQDAHEAVLRTRTSGEPYLECLQRQIDSRARFVQLWTGTDEKFDRPEWEKLVALARRFALPRPWKLTEPTATDYVPPKVEIPSHLVVDHGAPPAPGQPAGEPPGEAILADVRAAENAYTGASSEPGERIDDGLPPFLEKARRDG